MASQVDLVRVPKTNTPPARGTNIAECAVRTYGYRASYLGLWQGAIARLAVFWDAVWTLFAVLSPNPHRATRVGVMPHVRWFYGAQVSYVAHLCAGRPAGAAAIIDIQQGAWSQPQVRHLTRAQQRAEVQALNPQAKSPWKTSTTIRSPRGTS
jgi:hypothetical protein